jgi:hypothetical protein
VERLAAQPRPLLPTAPDEAAATLHRAGAVVVENAWPRQVMEHLGRAILEAHPDIADGSVLADRKNTGRGRFHAPVTVTAEVLDSGLFDAPLLTDLLHTVLGADYVIDSFGVLMAQPGAAEQHVHRDGGMLFPGTGLDRLLPPVALTVAIPLVDVGMQNAPTAVILGSHRQPDAEPSGESHAPEVPLGSFYVWDYRTLHYGLAHRGNEPRPVIFITPCRPYWSDPINFADGLRRLLASESVTDRLDQRFVRAVRVPG